MRLISSGDWQCSITNLDRCKVHVDQIVKELQESSKIHNTFFIFLGDSREVMNPVDQRVTNFLVHSFNRIKAVCSGFYYVTGNHDRITTQDGVASCAPVIEAVGARAVADSNWIKVPIRLLTWNPKVVQYLLLYLVPYFRDNQRQIQAFQESGADALLPTYRDTTCNAEGTDNIKILVFHNSISGCQQNLYTKGDGVSVKELHADSYDLCIGGHIHIPQFIKPNIYYAGSPFSMDWGEVNFEHRILSITIDESKK